MAEIITRVWDMPSRHTFTIPAIKTLLRRYVRPGEQWADPFSGFHSVANLTNDLNPDAPTKHHLQADRFAAIFQRHSLDGVLFDPPYSPRQISECYKRFGLEVGMKDTQNGVLYGTVKDTLSYAIRPGGLAISFGWNSGGFGPVRGFERVETLLVNHGGPHNDTICTVERKLLRHPSLFTEMA